MNPLWHTKNLAAGKIGSYASKYTDDLTLKGTYALNYDSVAVAPYLWNSQKSVFLSIENEQSIQAKTQYVVNKGLGGIMIWELAGDFALNSATNEYYIGTTLTDLIYTGFQGAAAYANLKDPVATAFTSSLAVNLNWGAWPLGDANYPIR